jgi:hypothetical protein
VSVANNRCHASEVLNLSPIFDLWKPVLSRIATHSNPL